MPGTFTNMVDYVRTQLDTFDQRDVCRVDSLVFSWLAYYRLPEGAEAASSDEGMELRDLYRAEWFGPLCDSLHDPASSRALLAAVAASPRFRNVRMCWAHERLNVRAEQQFAACTFVLSPHETFVAFRGTDNTVVGWKEDFNMSFATAVPSQVAAVRYLARVADATQGRLWCGGHSKGGNLAVYAGVMANGAVRSRIQRLYSHDGPGFSTATMDDPRWADARALVDKTIPQSSVVGMIFETQEDSYTVVHSHAAGLTQHDPFSWEVDWRDFVTEQGVGFGASLLDSSVNAWLMSTTPEQRERFVDTVFSVFAAAGETTFAGMRANWRVALPKILAAVSQVEPDDRQLVLHAVGDVLRALLPSVALPPQLEAGLPLG